MEIPYYIFGILYLLALGLYLFLVFFNLYHLLKFGFFDFTGKLNTLLFCCAWSIILFFTWFFLKEVSWLDSFDIFSEFSDLSGDILIF